MPTCNNCKKQLSCGCQEVKASNGVSVCVSCKRAYEEQLKIIRLNNSATTWPLPVPPTK